jgi:hypothetical protein
LAFKLESKRLECPLFLLYVYKKDRKKSAPSSLKKPDLHEEEKIQRKIETKQRRLYNGWVVRVVDGGGDSAGLVVAEQSMSRWSRRRCTVDGSSDPDGGWRPEMDEPVVVVAGGRRCSAGGWVDVDGVEGGRRKRQKAFGGKKNFGRNLNDARFV